MALALDISSFAPTTSSTSLDEHPDETQEPGPSRRLRLSQISHPYARVNPVDTVPPPGQDSLMDNDTFVAKG
jgi:hypothetical protein